MMSRLSLLTASADCASFAAAWTDDSEEPKWWEAKPPKTFDWSWDKPTVVPTEWFWDKPTEPGTPKVITLPSHPKVTTTPKEPRVIKVKDHEPSEDMHDKITKRFESTHKTFKHTTSEDL